MRRSSRTVSDLLSASSLFLASLGLLYGAWYREISAACSADAPQFREDRGPAAKQVRAAYRTRSLPLAVASAAVTVILAPPFAAVVLEAVKTWANLGFRAMGAYDAAKTLFCAVYLVTAGFALHTSHFAMRLRARLSELQG